MNDPISLESKTPGGLPEELLAANLASPGGAPAGSDSEERRFREMIDALPAAIYTTDAQGRLTHFNPAAVTFAGRVPQLGTDEWCVTWKLYHPDGTPMPHDECPMAIALKEGRTVRGAEAIAERPDGTRVWFTPYPTPLRDEAGRIVGAINMLVDITERKRADDTQKLLLDELNHRIKNTLASVQAIVQHTLRTTRDPAEFVDSIGGRIQSLARVHSLLTADTWRGADLRELIQDQLLQGAVDESRVTAWGPPVRLEAQTALHAALMLHELGTNAHKYGGLSTPTGWVTISWTVENGSLRLLWQERGGPPVSSPTRRGFGTTLIEQSIKGEGGEARMSVGADGIIWQILLPLPEAIAGSAPIAPEMIASRPVQPIVQVVPPTPSALAGRRFLVVEDEPIIALAIATSLEEAGAEVVASTGSHNEALKTIQSEDLDAAVLDGNLRGRRVDDIAAALTRRNIPFLFVSGYGRESLPPAFKSVAVLSKPFRQHELTEAAARLIGRRAEVMRLREK